MGVKWTGWNEVPGGFKTKVGLTAVRDVAGGNMALFATGLDERIYVNSTRNDKDWSGWSEVPGGGRTTVALCAASQEGAPFLYLAGKDEHIYVNSTADLKNWMGWSEVPGGGRTREALYAGDGYLFAAGLDERIFANSSTGPSEWKEVPGGGKTRAGLCGNGFNFSGEGGVFSLFCAGLDKRVLQNVFSVTPPAGPPTGKWDLVPGNGSTSVALTIAPIPGSDYINAYLFLTGTNNRIYVNECDGWNNWSGWTEVPGGGTTNAALAAVTDAGIGSQLFLFAKGIDERIFLNILNP
jgi:hypothetical protein